MNSKEELGVKHYSEMIAEVIFFMIVIAFSIYAIVDAAHIGKAIAGEPLGPDFLPRFLGTVIIVLSAPMLFNRALKLGSAESRAYFAALISRVTARDREEEKNQGESRIRKITSNQLYLFLLTFTISSLYVIALQYRVLWFPLSTMAFIFMLGTLIFIKEDIISNARKQIMWLFIVSVLLSAVFELIFSHWLGLKLP